VLDPFRSHDVAFWGCRSERRMPDRPPSDRSLPTRHLCPRYARSAGSGLIGSVRRIGGPRSATPPLRGGTGLKVPSGLESRTQTRRWRPKVTPRPKGRKQFREAIGAKFGATPLRRISTPNGNCRSAALFERTTGFEPATPTLA